MSPEKVGGFVPEKEKPKKPTSKKGRLAGALLGLGLSLGSAHAEEAGELPPPDEKTITQKNTSVNEEESFDSIVDANRDHKRSDAMEHETLSKIADMSINTLYFPKYVELVTSYYDKKRADEMIENFKNTLETEKDPKKREELAKETTENFEDAIKGLPVHEAPTPGQPKTKKAK